MHNPSNYATQVVSTKVLSPHLRVTDADQQPLKAVVFCLDDTVPETGEPVQNCEMHVALTLQPNSIGYFFISYDAASNLQPEPAEDLVLKQGDVEVTLETEEKPKFVFKNGDFESHFTFDLRQWHNDFFDGDDSKSGSGVYLFNVLHTDSLPYGS